MFHSKNEKLVEEVLREERVRFLCRSPPVTVSRSIPLSEVVELLRQEAVDCVVVVESDDDGENRPAEVDEASASRPRPVGIFTERDYLDKLVTLEPADWLNVKYNPVERHMTANLKLLSMDAPLGKAIQLMTKRGYRHLPIVDDKGELFGVISARDIVVYLAEHFPMEIYNRPPTRDQEQIFDTREGG